MKKGAIYTRVSTEEQAEKYSIASQKKELRSLALRQGYEIARIYDEGGVSGESLTGRGQMLQLLEDVATAPEIGALFIISLDRLSRNLKDNIFIREKLRDAGVIIITPAQTYDLHSLDGDLTLNIFGSIADYERKQILARCQRGRVEKKSGGGWLGGHAPKGYVYDRGSKSLRIDPDTEEMIHQVYIKSLLLSPYRLSLQLNAIGLRISPRQIRRLTERARVLFYNGKTIDYDGNVIDAEWPAIIDDDLARDLLIAKRTRRQNPAGTSAKYLLTGLNLFRCRFCGRTVKSFDGRNTKYYRCSSIQYGESCPNTKMRPMPLIDEIVWNAVSECFSNPELIERGYRQMSGNTKNTETARYESGLRDVETKRLRIVTAIADGVISSDDARQQMDALNRHAAEIHRAIKNLEPSPAVIPYSDYLDLVSSIDIKFMDHSDKRQLIGLLCERISLSKKALYIKFAVPFLTVDSKKIFTTERRFAIP